MQKRCKQSLRALMSGGNEFIQATKGVQVSQSRGFTMSSSVLAGMMTPLEPIERCYSKELSAFFKAHKNTRKRDNAFSSPALFLSDEGTQAVTKAIPRLGMFWGIENYLIPVPPCSRTPAGAQHPQISPNLAPKNQNPKGMNSLFHEAQIVNHLD